MDEELNRKIGVEVRQKELYYKLKKGDVNMNGSSEKDKNEFRNLLNDDKEVREFYYGLEVSLREGHILNGSLDVPGRAKERLQEKLNLYSGLYNEVRLVPVGVEGRVNIDVSELQFSWGGLKELDVSVDLVEIEDMKVGGYIRICNSALEDTTVDTFLYIENLLVKALANALDDAIINGKGDYVNLYEPVGILKDLPTENKVSKEFTLTNIIEQISLIDTGDKKDIGEVIAVMKRKTYYKDILPLANTTLDYPNVKGIRVKFSKAIEDDVIILGDFENYILGERSGAKITNSDHASFIEGQTVVRLVARYDGKPINRKAFVEITKA